MGAHVFQLLYNDNALYKHCIKLNEKILKDNGVDHVVFTRPMISCGTRSFCEDTDIDRMYYLSKNPNAIYLDADCIIKKWFDFEMEPGYPYISRDVEHYDMWAIFGNGCTGFFETLMQAYHKENDNPKQWWGHHLINNYLKEKVRPIPGGYIKHLHLGRSTSIIKRRGLPVMLPDFSIHQGSAGPILTIPEMSNV